jgi:ABC-type branched-subunit amino acid transport system substrate-binding protein
MENSQGSVQRGRARRSWRTKGLVAGVAVAAMVLSACGSGGSSKSGSTTTPPTASAKVVKVYGPGVTADSVKVGITLVNFDLIKDLPDVSEVRLDQEKIYQAYIDYINAHGGIAGKKIVPVYKLYLPVGSAGLITVCTALTEDDNVFATIGTYYDTSGDAQLCMAKQHKRVLLTFDLNQGTIKQAPPGLIVTPGNTPERAVKIMLDLLEKEHKLDGKTVGVMGNASSANVVNQTIVPELKKLGVKTGAVGILSISDTDTTTPQSQLDSLIERWKTENVDTVFISSKEAAALQFVQKVRAQLPDVQLLGDDATVLTNGQGATLDKIKPNPYEGIIVAAGPTHKEYENGPNWAYCKKIYKEQTGKDAPGPDDVIPYKGSTTKTIGTYGTINDACQLLSMFQDIGNKVGKWLNNDNWVNTVNNYGEIVNRGAGQYSSLHTGKYEADDNFRLLAFDSSLPPNGNWKSLTPLENETGGY